MYKYPSSRPTDLHDERRPVSPFLPVLLHLALQPAPALASIQCNVMSTSNLGVQDAVSRARLIHRFCRVWAQKHQVTHADMIMIICAWWHGLVTWPMQYKNGIKAPYTHTPQKKTHRTRAQLRVAPASVLRYDDVGI